jgi:hypothetical protein
LGQSARSVAPQRWQKPDVDGFVSRQLGHDTVSGPDASDVPQLPQ